MTQAQVDELLAFAAAEIARHEAGLTIDGGNGVTITGSGLEQSIAVAVPRDEEDEEEEDWKLYLFVTIEQTLKGTDYDGEAYESASTSERQVAAVVDGLTGDISPSYALEGIVFGRFPAAPTEHDPSQASITREVRFKFEARAYDAAALKDLAPGAVPEFDKGSYRLPVILTLHQIISGFNLDPGITAGQVVRSQTLTLRKDAAPYTPEPRQDNQWYEITVASLEPA